MKAAEMVPLWRQIIRESLWTRRGVVKTVHLWLPLAIMASMSDAGEAGVTVVASLQLLFASACFAQVCILSNDLTDSRSDRSSGRQRWMSGVSPGAGVVLICLVAVLGGVVLLLAAPSVGVLLCYSLALALGLFYSLRPVRFKGRGVLGPVAYSLSTTFGYLILPWAWLRGGWSLLALLAPAMFLDKWVHLHFHQVIDYEADRRSNTRTLAVALGLPLARRSLQWAASLASLSMVAVLVVLLLERTHWSAGLAGLGAAVTVSVGIYAHGSRKHPGRSSPLVRELPWHYLGLCFTLFRVMPLALFTLGALEKPSLWVVFLIVAFTILLEGYQTIRYRYP